MDLRECVGFDCEIKTIDNYLLTAAKIREVTQEYIEIYNPFGRMPLQACSAMLKIMILHSDFPMMVGEVYLSTDQFLRLVHLQKVEEFEKRVFYRVDTYVVVHLVPPEVTVAELFDKQIENKRLAEEAGVEMVRAKAEGLPPPPPFEPDWPVPAVLVNASVSGMRFYSKQYFSGGDKLGVVLEFAGRQILFPCVVRRVTVIHDRREYGCEILECSERDQNLLSRFLMEKQREGIRHHKRT